jgi:hypothetical protein
MRIFKPYLAVFALLTISSQLDAASILASPVNTRKMLSDETREVSGFSGISSAGSYNVFITMGNTESLKIEGDSEQISLIETVVEDGILKIRTKNRNKSWKQNFNGKVNIYVTAKSLEKITLSGSGNIKVSGVVKANDLNTTLSGSGSISLSVDADNYTATISGSGGINVKGNAENAKINLSGSGSFEGRDLKTSATTARVNGSGGVRIQADKSIEAAMSGSGNIRYSGNASVRSTKSGSGNISKM